MRQSCLFAGLFALVALLLLTGEPWAGQGKGAGKGKGKDKKGKPAVASYYPLKVGNSWEYHAGKEKVTVRVVREEMVGQVPVAVLEYAGKGKPTTERVAVRKDGVYRYSGGSVDYEPPLCILKLPPSKGATWTVKSRGDGLQIVATFTEGMEEVSVPRGKYEAVTSSSQDFRIDTVKMKVAYWFVPGIGMVKQRVQVGGREVLLELVKYTPAK